MKRSFKEDLRAVTVSLLLILVCAAVIRFPAETAAAVRRSSANCLNMIIPSLFAMMVLSRLLISSGLYRNIGRPFSLVARYVFRIPEELFPIFIISMAAGYPVGAALLSEACDSGASRDDAADMLCWCFGAGPAFIFGTVGAGIFGSVRCGGAVFVSCIAANILLGIFMGIGKPVPPRSEKPAPPVFTAEMLNSAVTGGGCAMLKMCAAVLFMSALLAVPDALGLSAAAASFIGKMLGKDPRSVYVILRSAAEITNITFLDGHTPEYLPAAAAAVSFGGISVFMQIKAVCGGRFSVLKLAAARLSAALISGISCELLCSALYTETTVAAAAHYVRRIRHNPPLASIFLLIMTILLLSQKRVVKSEKV